MNTEYEKEERSESVQNKGRIETANYYNGRDLIPKGDRRIGRVFNATLHNETVTSAHEAENVIRVH